MKEKEKEQDDFDEMGDVYDWDEDGDPDHEVGEGGCWFVLILILLVWWGAYELIKWLS